MSRKEELRVIALERLSAPVLVQDVNAQLRESIAADRISSAPARPQEPDAPRG